MNPDSNTIEARHDKHAPYWAIALFTLCGIGIATTFVDLGKFWKGYVLDMTGPAWNYILIRGLFTSYADNIWTRFFTAKKTMTIFLFLSVGFETAQYFKLYDATYDPWDFLAYISILVPAFVIDLKLNKSNS
jgi:hypothetical protein